MQTKCYDSDASSNWNEEHEVSCDSNEVVFVDGIHKLGMIHISDIVGYWLSTTYESVSSLNVRSDGFIYPYDVDFGGESSNIGIRPVITISKNDLN